MTASRPRAFDEAWNLLVAGRQARRRAWLPDARLSLDAGVLYLVTAKRGHVLMSHVDMTDVIARDWEEYVVAFDWPQALAHMRAGRSTRRQSWTHGLRLHVNDKGFALTDSTDGERLAWSATLEDMSATDWRLA